MAGVKGSGPGGLSGGEPGDCARACCRFVAEYGRNTTLPWSASWTISKAYFLHLLLNQDSISFIGLQKERVRC